MKQKAPVGVAATKSTKIRLVVMETYSRRHLYYIYNRACARGDIIGYVYRRLLAQKWPDLDI